MLRTAWLWVCLAVVIGPATFVLVKPTEAWPWTCAPMFAAPLDDVALYRPRLVVVAADGKESAFHSGLPQLAHRHYLRLLLVKAYGSVEPSSPHGYIEGDTRERLRERLDAFFDATMSVPRPKKHPPDARSLRFEIVRSDEHGPKRTRVVGTYDFASSTFTMSAP